jgi:hypothetical protein
MTISVPETVSPSQQQPPSTSRRRTAVSGCLVLSELNPRMVIDHFDEEDQTLHVLTFGTVREICPKCRTNRLNLVLRQSSVRIAHLFCADCTSCFDAHYENGAPALTI